MLTTFREKGRCVNSAFVFNKWGPVEIYKKGKKLKTEAEILKYYCIIRSTTERERASSKESQIVHGAPLGFSESDTAASHILEARRYAITIFLRPTKHRNKQIKSLLRRCHARFDFLRKSSDSPHQCQLGNNFRFK